MQPPSHLAGAALVEWQRMAELLPKQTDRALLEAYCVSYARWLVAEGELAKTGPVVRSPQGGAVQNPWLAVSRASLRDFVKCLADMGLPKPSAAEGADSADADEPPQLKYYKA